ncbi:hypothetical protein [Candidatus Symbiopectobacterium sp. NZEC151]|uniref:hypothetical protein n=1 Tax=Candidatus Symbiopectobacterium sp. NZEC151 TaxID=2820470 RepID=UPI0022278896|nr:hypothetical protein [Candidatus Symbiopectobacterium sp. NZEC151]MCW2474951.1 hypothetical protein [Candidatus Symbiopectobacterium sp. NZEC151]
MRKTFSLSLKPLRATQKIFLYFQKNTDLTHGIFTANKQRRKPVFGRVVKDCSTTVLSTAAAQESHNKIPKIAKNRDVKAVNQTSSDDLSRLSQKSVDNLV